MSIAAAREQAKQLYAQVGLPNTRNEHWKYTDISGFSALLETASMDENKADTGSFSDADITGYGIEGLDAYRVVLRDGKLVATCADLPKGVTLTSLATVCDEQVDSAGVQLENLFHVSGDEPLFQGLVALNVAQATDGVTLCLADGVVLDKPLYILHIGGQTSHIRHGFLLGKHSQAVIVEHFVGDKTQQHNHRALRNVGSNVILQDGAICEHYRLQLEDEKHSHFSRVEVKQHGNSSYTLHAVELGGLLSRSDVVIDLAGQGAACNLHGLFVLAGRQHVDHHTHVDHHASHCQSKEHYRTVLDGRSHGVFNGKVVVHPGAIKTDSAQSNANILLSTKAEVDTKPELEIYNDDVKCAHGATVGQLDQAQLFYLRSRGLSESEAKEVLTFAFADAVLTAMGNRAIRRFVEQQAFSKLPHSGGLEGLLG